MRGTRERQTALTTCPHPKCSKLIPTTQYACREHWFSLPREIRTTINAAWRRVLRGDKAGIDQHDRAKDEAQAFWRLRP